MRKTFIINLTLVILFIGKTFATGSPILEWSLDNNDGFMALDTSGNDFHGEILSGSWLEVSQGKALSWNDEKLSGIIYGFGEKSLLNTDEFSVEFRTIIYEYPSEVRSGNRIPVNNIIQSPLFGIGLNELGQIYLTLSTGSSMFLATQVGSIPIGVWTRVGLTYDSGTRVFVLYINGVEIERKTSIYELKPITANKILADFPSQEYAFVVRPKSNSNNWSLFKGAVYGIKLYNEVIVPRWPSPDDIPGVPQEITATRDKKNINIIWKSPMPDFGIYAHSYNIYRSIDEAPYVKIAHAYKKTSFVDLNVSEKSIKYAISALDYWGNEGGLSQPALVSGVGIFSGIVLSSNGNLPLEDAEVRIVELNSVQKTDKNGQFLFNSIDQGNYEITIEKNEHILFVDSISIYETFETEKQFVLIYDSQIPPAPQLVSVDNELVGALRLKWNIIEEKPILFYKIYRTMGIIDQWSHVATVYDDNNWVDSTVTLGDEYSYYITAVDYAQNESFASEFKNGIAVSPPKPLIISPSNESLFVDKPVTFFWEYEADYVGDFELQIARNNLFDNDTISISTDQVQYDYYREVVDSGNKFLYNIGLPDGVWFWRVRALYDYGSFSPFSDVGSIVSANTKCWSKILTPRAQIRSYNSTKEPIHLMPTFIVSPKILDRRNSSPKIDVTFVLSKPAKVRIYLINLRGKIVEVLLESEHINAGSYRYDFTLPERLAAGMYFVYFSANDKGFEQKINQRLLIF